MRLWAGEHESHVTIILLWSEDTDSENGEKLGSERYSGGAPVWLGQPKKCETLFCVKMWDSTLSVFFLPYLVDIFHSLPQSCFYLPWSSQRSPGFQTRQSPLVPWLLLSSLCRGRPHPSPQHTSLGSASVIFLTPCKASWCLVQGLADFFWALQATQSLLQPLNSGCW